MAGIGTVFVDVKPNLDAFTQVSKAALALDLSTRGIGIDWQSAELAAEMLLERYNILPK